MDCSGAETARVKQFEILSHGGAECRLSTAYYHRMEKQVTFLDEIGFECECCQFGRALVRLWSMFSTARYSSYSWCSRCPQYSVPRSVSTAGAESRAGFSGKACVG